MSERDDLPILASDADRDRAVAGLREAVGEGRLTLEEFTERVDAAHRARTDKDLALLARDLPATAAAAGAEVAAGARVEEHRAICSRLDRNGPWSLPQRSSWFSLFGTIELDLRSARLADRETTLFVRNIFGTVTVIVPEGLEVVVRGGGLFASQKIESSERAPLPDGPRLVIECRGPGGTLHVRPRRPANAIARLLGSG